MRKGNRFRFTLQWAADSQERNAAGEFLERLGNKKSDVIVMALWEYLQQHPEAAAPDARIKITAQPILSKEQILSEVKEMIRTYIAEMRPALSDSSEIITRGNPLNAVSEDDLNVMLENLDVFEQ